jgi:hypothetical protein
LNAPGSEALRRVFVFGEEYLPHRHREREEIQDRVHGEKPRTQRKRSGAE